MREELAAQIAADHTYQRTVRPAVFLDAVAVATPELIMVAGPPGAGKTDLIDERAASVRERTGASPVVLDADALRKHVPGYDEVKHRPQLMIAHTAPYVDRWMSFAAEQARADGFSVVVQRAMRFPAWSIAELSTFKRAGFRVVLAVIAGLPAESRLEIVGRYLSAVRSKGLGRSVPEDFHQDAWRNLRPALIDAAETGDVDVIEVWERIAPVPAKPAPLASARRHPDGWAGRELALAVFDRRRAAMPADMLNAWFDFYSHVADVLADVAARPDGRALLREVEESLALLREDAKTLRQ